MIRINKNITTPDGGTLASGAIIDVTAEFKSYIVDLTDGDTITGTSVQHNCYFNANIYRSMSDYENKIPRVKTTFLEFNIGYVQEDIDLTALNASAGMLDTVFGWFQSHIENGDNKYPGTGTGTTEVVYPF